ncbi:hypothetical protein ILP92_00840 [Maribius pontilimi]|uniref:Uncharacterized protein n=1 Tax=Palleronia pontilimi TaxID=1964209 RepID=A0A934M8E2_9RHOB|nr:hypothetical protein [Palleronia pontilimi]MBJ3761297.1 hypothetical protein [Palleronia pontilimi]
MSATSQIEFDRRSSRIIKKSKLMKGGAVHSVRKDGLIVRRPRRATGLPWRGLLRVGLALWVFKVAAVLNLGLSDYQDRNAALAEGELAERLAAFVMQADPITVVAVDKVQALSAAMAQLERVALF